MNALFLIPPASYNLRGLPVDRVYGCNYGFDYKPAIHFVQAATAAREWLGWNVRFLDCPAEGMDATGFEAYIRQSPPDVLVTWSTYLSAPEDVRAARYVASVRPDVRHVAMGSAPTWRPQEFHVSQRTHILLGEPELSLRELGETWAKGQDAKDIAGVGTFDKDGTFRRGGFRDLLDVSELPMPDRGLLLGRYTANRLSAPKITAMAVSRGCGFKCTFCITNAVDQTVDLEYKRFGNKAKSARPPLRKRTPEQIIAEFEDIARRGIGGVEIADNIFTWGKARTTEICNAIAPLGLEFICLARANMLHDSDMLEAMHRAGCKLVYMGSESFDDGLLDDMQKELKVDDVRKAVVACRAAGIEPEVSVLIGGSPNETWGTLYRSWKAARSLGTRFVHFSVAIPSPSSDIYDQALEQGWFRRGDFHPADNQREVIVDLPNLSAEELRLALKLAYAGQYLSPRGLVEQLKEVRSMDQLRRKAASGLRLFGFLGDRDSAVPAVPPGRVTPA